MITSLSKNTSSLTFQRLSNQPESSPGPGFDLTETPSHRNPFASDEKVAEQRWWNFRWVSSWLSNRLDSRPGPGDELTETSCHHNLLISDEEKVEAKVEEKVEEKVEQKVEQTVGQKRWDLRWAVSWILMLSRELGGSFVFGIIVVYGCSQGFGSAVNKVVVDYYWKDIQGAEPSSVQMYNGLSAIPWDVKPIWGILTDIVPMAGYHRRPYLLISGLFAVTATTVLVSGGKLWVPMAVGMLVLKETGTALSDATIDAEVALKSRQKPTLAADIQSLCAIAVSVGSLLGYVISGPSVWKLGVLGALSLMYIPAFLLLLIGFVLREKGHATVQYNSASEFWNQLWTVTLKLWTTLKLSQVWRPTLYMYISIAISPDISEGKFYWYTSSAELDGPGFSESFIGTIYATGAVGTIGAVYLYHKKLKKVSFRWILFWVQLLVAVFGILDFILVTRLNRRLGIPDRVFVVGDEGMTKALSRLKWIPLLILAAKLCPPGIEGTFFAFLMSVDNVGLLTSSWLGALLLRVTKVTRDSFTYLWLAVLIRNFLRLVPLFLIFLLPNTDPDEDILVPDDNEDDQEDAEDSQLVEM